MIRKIGKIKIQRYNVRAKDGGLIMQTYNHIKLT